MTPAQLKAYAAIVRLGSAKAASLELGVSEAAISAHTAALRKELNDPLYRRAGGGLAFTPGGMRLATRAAELLGLQDQTRQEVLAAAQGQRMLRLATTNMFAEYAAPGLIELFKTRADDLRVEMSIHHHEELDELLTSRQAEVTVGPARLTGSELLRSREFLKYQLITVVAKNHPLAKRRVRPNALTSQTWLLGPSAADPSGATAMLLKRFAVPEQNQRIFQSHAAAMSEVREGNGIGIAPEFRIQEELKNDRLCQVIAPGSSASNVWTANTLLASQASGVALELVRFMATPRAIQAMLTGSGADIGRFRPSVHITLWS